MTSYQILSKKQRFVEMSFPSIQEALEYAHDNGVPLYEDDEGGPNLLYSPHWDTHQQRHTWITLRTVIGLKTGRRHLPTDLKFGTEGKEFYVK